MGTTWDAPRFSESAIVLIDEFVSTSELRDLEAACIKQTCPLPPSSHAVVDTIEERIAQLVGIPVAPQVSNSSNLSNLLSFNVGCMGVRAIAILVAIRSLMCGKARSSFPRTVRG